MTKPTSEQGLLSVVYEQKTHDTLNTCLYACFLSQIEHTSIAKDLFNSSWVEAMQEELLQFKLQQSAFLYETIEEEVYVTQPPGFKDPDHPDKVYKVVKALYRLHQAPRSASTPVDLEKPLVKDGDADDVVVLLYRIYDWYVKRGRDTKIPQSSGPPVNFGNEAVHKELGGRMERAATTASSLKQQETSALVDKKRVIITESSIRSDLHLADAGGIDYLSSATIFEELLGDMSHHKKIYVNLSHIKKIFANMKREGKDFSRRVTPLFATMMVQATQAEGVDSGIPIDSQQTPITTQPSSSRPQKKQSRTKQRNETEVPQDETHHDDNVPIPSNDPLLSGEDRMQLTELMILCTNLQKQVVNLEKAKDAQVKEIAVIKKRGRIDDAKMFDIDDLHDEEVVEDSAAPTIPVTTADEGVTAAKIDEITPTSAPTTVIDELTLAQTLIEIKAAKPKSVTTASTITTTRPKARGVVVQEPNNVALDEEMARNLEAQLQAELIEEEKMARKKEE
ncbi:putative ribonuclease H-like domain-containing protein [Tanacetum coccineum]